MIRRKGAQPARAIASSLRTKHETVSRGDVNRILYGGLGTVFSRSENEQPLWSLISHADTGPEEPKTGSPELVPGAKLIVPSERARTPAAVRQIGQR